MSNIDLSRWPCGHIRNALNTRKLGNGREVCARCRSEIDHAAYLRPERVQIAPGASILAEVAGKYHTTVHAIRAYRGTMDVWPAKHEAYARLRDLGWSYPQIARFMGRKDHQTVIHGVRAFRERTSAC